MQDQLKRLDAVAFHANAAKVLVCQNRTEFIDEHIDAAITQLSELKKAFSEPPVFTIGQIEREIKQLS